MHYAEIKNRDIANGLGVRVSLFVSGCRHKCLGCFNEVAWKFDFGKEFTDATANELLELLLPDYVQGLTLLGGEPFEPENQSALSRLLLRVRKELPQKDIWAYTGFTLDELLSDGRARTEHTDEMLSCIDVLVDGRFVLEEKDITLRFRGSRNQRLLDLPKSLKATAPVLWDSAAHI